MKTPLPSVDSDRPTRSSSPRFICRAVRRMQAGRDAVAPANGGGWLGRHAANCADCARYFAAAARLENRLRAEAAATMTTVLDDMPAGLEERMWAAVQPEVVGQRRTARRWDWATGMRSFGGMTALAGIALVALGVVWLRQDPNSSLDPEIGNGAEVASASGGELSAADLRELAGSIRSISESWLRPVDAVAVSAQAGPLEEEWQALGQDTASAWRFLEQNFLPSNARQSDASETKT